MQEHLGHSGHLGRFPRADPLCSPSYLLWSCSSFILPGLHGVGIMALIPPKPQQMQDLDPYFHT